jgi:hypothetical protein
LLFDCPTLTPDTAKTSRVLSKGVHLLARARHDGNALVSDPEL